MRGRMIALMLVASLGASACSSDETPSVDAEAGAPTTTTVAGEAAVAESAPSTTAAERADPDRGDFYAADHRWLCRPDLTDDVCDRDLDVTVIEADGTRTVEPFEPAVDPSIDCFYVYPTVALDPAGNADIEDDDNRQEERAVLNQAARFGEVCRVFAPLYRQGSLGSITGAQKPDRELAYGDVVESFHHYLDRWNEGRPFVLMGHSQGAGLLSTLITEEIDPEEALRTQLVSALLIGISVHVPAGADVGADFRNIPACRAPDQIGCVISYASYRATDDDTISGFFGAHNGERHPICTNPGALAGGPAELDPIFNGANGVQAAADTDPVATPWIRYPGLVTAECVTTDTHTYLSVSVNADPNDRRVDDVGGDFLPGWGLHIIDVNLGLDALIELVVTQTESIS